MRNVQISGRNIGLSESLSAYVHDAISGVLDKFDIAPLECSAVFYKHQYYFSVDVSLHICKSRYFRVKGEGDTAYVSVDNAISKLLSVLRKYKKKVVDHYKHRDSHASDHVESSVLSKYVIGVDSTDELDGARGDAPVVIEELKMPIRTLSLSDAVCMLEVEGRNVLIFRNANSKVLNIIFKRDDGNIGWVDPSLNEFLGTV